MLDLLKEVGLYACNSFTKHIPQEYLINSYYNREQLLDGLLATDGTISQGGLFSYSTVSEQLNKDFIFLVKSLGYDVYNFVTERSIEKGAFSNTPVFNIGQVKGYKHG